MNLLIPRKTKYRKFQKRGLIRAIKKQPNTHHLRFGQFGVFVKSAGYLETKKLEVLRRTFVRKFRKSGKLWIRVYPHFSLTRKPNETRMGKGKGSPKLWVAHLGAGQILFEMSGISDKNARQAFLTIAKKTKFKLGFCYRRRVDTH
jgi:large subunit ribosomal protein L16